MNDQLRRYGLLLAWLLPPVLTATAGAIALLVAVAGLAGSAGYGVTAAELAPGGVMLGGLVWLVGVVLQLLWWEQGDNERA